MIRRYINGKQFYFDILGKTNKTKTHSVTIVKTLRFRRKAIVISDQTKEIFITKTKYLTPINKSNSDNIFLIRNNNNLIKLEEADYAALTSIKKSIKDLLNRTNLDNDKYNEIIEKFNAIFDLVLNKMAIIIKNNQESDILENITNRQFNSIESSINNASEFKVDLSVDEIQDLVNKFSIRLNDYFMNHLHLKTIDDDDLIEYVKKFYPPQLMILPDAKYCKITKEDISKISKDIFDVVNSTNINIFIPYIDINSLEIECLIFKPFEDTIDDIKESMSEIFLNKYKGKVPFRIVSLHYKYDTYPTDEYTSIIYEDEDEDDDYEK